MRNYFYRLSLLCAMLTVVLVCCGYAVDAEASDDVTYDVVTDFGADGSDTDDDSAAFVRALATARTASGTVTINVPAGTYYIGQTLSIYSNTNLILDDEATLIATFDSGVMLISLHLNDDGTVCAGDETCTHGGYTQAHDITISGGTWDRGDTEGTSNSTIVVMRHAQNITLENMTFKNATNHFLNLSGDSNVTVSNCVFQDATKYTGTDSDFWGDVDVTDDSRFATIEAIHLDFMDDDGEPGVYPSDNTPCTNITITGCTFSNVFSGIGCHHLAGGDYASYLTVDSCTFTSIGYRCFNLYNFTDVSITNNTAEDVSVFVNAVESEMVLSGNTVSSSENTVYVTDGCEVTLTSNNFTNTGDSKSVIGASYSCVINASDNTFTAEGSSAMCVYLGYYNETYLSGNTLNATNATNGTGIYMGVGCTGTITGNKIPSAVTAINILNNCTDVEISGNTITGTTKNAIYMYTDISAVISDNTISSTGNTAICADTDCNITVTGNTIKTTGSHGIYVSSNVTLTASDNSISDCGGSGMYVSTSSNADITGNNFISSVANAIYIYGSCTVNFSNNVVQSAGAAGIRINSSCTVTADGNQILDATTNGISVEGNSVLTASNNVVASPGSMGIYLVSADGSSVTDNDVTGSGSAGIYIKTTNGCLVDGNIVTDTGSHAIIAVGDSSQSTTATITNNTAITGVTTAYDIRISSYCADCVVKDNIVGNMGVGVASDSTCTQSNNVADTTDYGDELTIIVQPESVSVSSGDLFSMHVTASGSGLTYQWYYKKNTGVVFSKWSGKTASILNSTANDSYSNMQIYCVITDENGDSIQTDTVVLTIIKEEDLAITTQPKNVSIENGDTFTMSVSATGEDLTYQWYYKKTTGSAFAKWSGKTSASFSSGSNATYHSMQVYCVITDKYGDTVTTDTVTITLTDVELTITSQPKSATVAVGDKVTFSITATGDSLTYQWYYKKVTGSTFYKWSGKTDASFTTATNSTYDGMQIYCIVTDSYGETVQSNTITLSLTGLDLSIVKQPSSVTVALGDTATFSLFASGDDLTYQWYYKKVTGSGYSKWSGKTSASFTTGTNSTYDGMQVYCIVTDGEGNTAQSNTVTLSLTGVDLTIVKQPSSASVASGGKVTFSLFASGDDLTYQWYYKKVTGSSFSKWSGKTSASFTTGTNSTYDGMQVYCIVTDGSGNTVQSNTVTISLTGLSTSIVVQPTDVTVASGGKATFSLFASGDDLTYQWYYKKVTGSTFSKWSGKTSSSFTTGTNSTYDGMQVYCIVTDGKGKTVQSNTVTLSMTGLDLAILKQPSSVSISSGDKFTLSLFASGDGLTYQWYYKKSTGSTFSKWSGKTSASFTSGSNSTYNGMQVYCIVTDKYGNTVKSNTITLTVK